MDQAPDHHPGLAPEQDPDPEPDPRPPLRPPHPADQIAPISLPYYGFLLQIVRPDGSLLRLPAGGDLEADLIETCVQMILARGVAFKTTSHVEADIRAGIRDALNGYKFQATALSHTVHPAA